MVPPTIAEEQSMAEGVRALASSGHVDAAVNMAEFDAFLEAAVARPAIRTLETIPRQHRVRVAEILTSLMIAHVDAQRATACGGQESEEAALWAARMLWIAPALLLRAVRCNEEDVLAQAPTQLGSRGVERASEVRGRLQLAEAGRWLELIAQYLRDIRVADEHDRRRMAMNEDTILPMQPQEDKVVFQKVAAKVMGGALRSAAELLFGAVHAPLAKETAEAVDALVAVPVEEEELRAQREEVLLAAACAAQVQPVKHRLVRRRLRVLNTAAQPGLVLEERLLPGDGRGEGRSGRHGKVVHHAGQGRDFTARRSAMDERDRQPDRLRREGRCAGAEEDPPDSVLRCCCMAQDGGERGVRRLAERDRDRARAASAWLWSSSKK